MKTRQSGQAATECIIASALVLVPLFILLPVIGKYIDIKHAMVQQARFEVWEYSSWFGDSSEVFYGGDDNQRAGYKGFEQTRTEGSHYFFSDPRSDSYEDLQTYSPNPLWVDHKGKSLFAEYSSNSVDLGDSYPKCNFMLTTKGTQWLMTMLNAFKNVFDFIEKTVSDILQFVGGTSARFDAYNLKGYYSTKLQLKLRPIEEILPNSSQPQVQKFDPLVFTAGAGLQTNTWASGSTEQASEQSRGLVLSTILSPLSNAWNVIPTQLDKFMTTWNKMLFWSPIVPDIEFGNLYAPCFGYVTDEVIPYEHLKNAKGKAPKKLYQQHIDPPVKIDIDTGSGNASSLGDFVEKVQELLKDGYDVPIYYYAEEKK